MNETLKGKGVVITGGTSGVGRATALLCAAQGANVFICGRDQKKLDGVLSELAAFPVKSGGTTTDVSNGEEVKNFFKAATDLFGSIDVLVNNAGLPGNSILNSTHEEWKRVIDTNLFGYFNCTEAAVSLMRGRGGQIVNIGSLGVRVLDNGADLYMAAKAAVAGFTHSMRKQLVSEHIKMTLINPGAIGSGMVTETKEQIKEKIAHEEMLRPEDVAEAIIFCITRPTSVDITELEIRPHRQSLL